MANEIMSVEGQLVGIPLQEYTAGPGIVVDNVNHIITFDVGQWEDVATEAQYNTGAVSNGGFQIKYNALLKLLSVSCDVNLKAGAQNIFTWSNRLKPVATQFALGSGLYLYVSQSTLYQPSSAASRWVNGVWMWPVVGGSN